MVTVTQPLIFELHWRRDAQGYRVLRTVDHLRELARRRERSPQAAGTDPKTGRASRRMTEDWPDHWPAAGEWIDYWIKSALRGTEDPAATPVEYSGRAPVSGDEQVLAASKHDGPQPSIPGEGLIWPESNRAESFLTPRDTDDEDGRGLAEQMLATVGETPSDHSDVLDFTRRCGLLWEDGPLTVEEFRTIRDNLHLLAMQGDSFRGKIARLERHEYEGLARDEADRHALYAPRFRMELRKQQGRRGLVPQMVPDNLYSLITLQVTEGVYSGSVRWRRCDHCGGLFLAGTGTNRGGKSKFCTTSCKNKHADRKRKRKPATTRQAKQAKYANEVCPYCADTEKRPKRNPHHCGNRACTQKHYRANQKARATSA